MTTDTQLDLREFFATELRRYRQSHHLAQADLAHRINYSAALVGMVEKRQRLPTRDFTERCDKALETGGALSRLLPLLHMQAYPSWFRPFVEIEAEALAIQEFEVQVVPGLLQTEEYARAVLKTWPPMKASEVEARLAARLERQRIFTRDDPPLLWYVLDEGILQRIMGSAQVMADQLRHLIVMADLPYIQLQILTFDRAGRVPCDGSFFLFELENRERMVYAEGAGSGHLITSPADVERCVRVFDAARAQALSPEDSVEYISQTLGELYAVVEEQS